MAALLENSLPEQHEGSSEQVKQDEQSSQKSDRLLDNSSPRFHSDLTLNVSLALTKLPFASVESPCLWTVIHLPLVSSVFLTTFSLICFTSMYNKWLKGQYTGFHHLTPRGSSFCTLWEYLIALCNGVIGLVSYILLCRGRWGGEGSFGHTQMTHFIKSTFLRAF